MDWSTVKHFQPHEFDDPEHSGSSKWMNPTTIKTLDRLREKTGIPIITHNKFGIKGCVCVQKTGHSKNSLHYIQSGLCSAVDWHFLSNTNPRDLALTVLQSGFTGIGIYYDWHWENSPLTVGFHVDTRKTPQIWVRNQGNYTYLLK